MSKSKNSMFAVRAKQGDRYAPGAKKVILNRLKKALVNSDASVWGGSFKRGELSKIKAETGVSYPTLMAWAKSEGIIKYPGESAKKARPSRAKAVKVTVEENTVAA